MTVKSTTELRPWSYRQNALVKSLITIAAGVASAFVGTFAHRMGAELNIPYGLVLAFLLIAYRHGAPVRAWARSDWPCTSSPPH